MGSRDIFPYIALVLGTVMIVVAILLGGTLNSFISIDSFVVTILGSLCALVVSYSIGGALRIPKLLLKVMDAPDSDRLKYITIFGEMSKKARKDGLLAIEDDIQGVGNEYLTSGMQMVIDGVEPEGIRGIMELEIETLENRHKVGHDIFDKWGAYAPAFGMIGTLIGLINMLADMQDADSIAVGMATALITTFYGAVAANLVFIPIADNLKAKTAEEVYTREMILEGILEIQAGTNPRLIEEKLKVYLTPAERASLSEEQEAAEETREAS
jgi:chemotaxis protein MotA